MTLSSIKETCLYVKDLEKCFHFYHDLLNLELISRVEGRHVFFRLGDGVLLCFDPDVTANETRLPPHYASGKQHIAFEVSAEDYDPWKRRINNHGIAIIHEEFWRDGINSFYFEDPDGNVLEIVQPGLWD